MNIATGEINRGLAAVLLTLLVPSQLFAQPSRPCEPRVEVGGAIGLLTVDIPVDIGRAGLAKATGTGLEGSIRSTLPISEKWSVKAKFGFGSMAVVQERDASGEYIHRATGDDIAVRWFNAGLQGHREGRWTCAYTSAGVGVYRCGFRGAALNAPGVAATMGIEMPAGRLGAWFVELGVSVALTRMRSPLAEDLVANLRPAVGWLYRF